jgi:hypothetical protein
MAVKVKTPMQPVAEEVIEQSAEKVEEAVSAKKMSLAERMARQGKTIRANLTEEQKSLEGIWSDKLNAIPLGANKFPQKTVIGGEKTMEATIVGYEVSSSEIDFEVEEIIEGQVVARPVKAGEVVILTRTEIGLLGSRPEVSLIIGDKKLQFRSNQKTGITPLLSSMTDVAIKHQMKLIDKKEGEAWVCLPEYKEKFNSLYEKRRGAGLGRVGSTSSKTKDADNLKNIAAGFRSYYNSKFSASK